MRWQAVWALKLETESHDLKPWQSFPGLKSHNTVTTHVAC